MIGVSDDDWQQRKNFVGFGVAEEDILRELHLVAKTYAHDVMDELYARWLKYPELKRFFPDDIILNRVKASLPWVTTPHLISFGLKAQCFFSGGPQIRRHKGFRDAAIARGVQKSPPFLRRCPAGCKNHRFFQARPSLSNLFKQFNAIKIGHVQVAEN